MGIGRCEPIKVITSPYSHTVNVTDSYIFVAVSLWLCFIYRKVNTLKNTTDGIIQNEFNHLINVHGKYF